MIKTIGRFRYLPMVFYSKLLHTDNVLNGIEAADNVKADIRF